MSMFKAAALATILGSTTACSLHECANDTLASVQSPDGQEAAILFERNCGATTAASIHLAIVPISDMPNETGNALIFSKMTTDAQSYRLHWTDGGHVNVNLPKGAEVYLRQQSVGGTVIKVVQEG
ncbi:MAG: hypothetical protein ACOYO0_10025 [Sandarakinorhabdus sp.]